MAKRLTDKQIVAAFDANEELHGDHKSTAFLCAVTADQLGLTAEEVHDALFNECAKVAKRLALRSEENQ